MKTGQIQTQLTRNKSCENIEEQELKFKNLENTFDLEGKYRRKSKRSQTEKTLKKMTYTSVLNQRQKQAFSLIQIEINERQHQKCCQELSKTTNNNKQANQDPKEKRQIKLWSQKGALSKPKGLGIDQQIINISNTDYLERHFPKLAVEKEKQLIMQLKENNKDLPKKLKNKFYQDIKVENQDAQKKIQTVYNIHTDYWKDPYSSDWIPKISMTKQFDTRTKTFKNVKEITVQKKKFYYDSFNQNTLIIPTPQQDNIIKFLQKQEQIIPIEEPKVLRKMYAQTERNLKQSFIITQKRIVNQKKKASNYLFNQEIFQFKDQHAELRKYLKTAPNSDILQPIQINSIPRTAYTASITECKRPNKISQKDDILKIYTGKYKNPKIQFQESPTSKNKLELKSLYSKCRNLAKLYS